MALAGTVTPAKVHCSDSTRQVTVLWCILAEETHVCDITEMAAPNHCANYNLQKCLLMTVAWGNRRYHPMARWQQLTVIARGLCAPSTGMFGPHVCGQIPCRHDTAFARVRDETGGHDTRTYET